MSSLPNRPDAMPLCTGQKRKCKGPQSGPKSSKLCRPNPIVGERLNLDKRNEGDLSNVEDWSGGSIPPTLGTYTAYDISRLNLPGNVDSEDAAQLKTAWNDVFGPENLEDDVLSDNEKENAKHYSDNQRRHGFRRQAFAQIREARLRENTYQFNDFDYGLATNDNDRVRRAHLDNKNAPDQMTEWVEQGIRCRRAISVDGKDLLYHLPGTLRPKSLNLYSKIFVDYGMRFKKLEETVSKGADQRGRNSKDSYVFNGNLVGCVKLVKAWQGTGHTKQEELGISKDFLHTAQGFRNSISLLSCLRLLSLRVNDIYQAIDPRQYGAMEEIMKRANSEIPYLKMLNELDPLMMEGRALMFNRTTPPHVDQQDPLHGWAILVVLGNFTEGTLLIPRLNLRLRYIPGDIVVLRGRILVHEVELWVGEQRISLAHFTHANFWKAFDVECPGPQ